ncbi:hypothetical protein [Desulfuromonas sp. TF]|uniref:hypothetical protein n=1 Tax=Desulfuromonas sp. TF TaxID=1232410 RepID=UPI0004813069|nr:hypothetical protein [Desulfuromonas sp. TF]
MMGKKRWRNLRVSLVVLAGAIALAACGGGGGSDSGEPTYPGNTKAAVIDGQNAEEIALSAYEGGELQAGMGIDPTEASMGSLALAQTLSTSLLAEDLPQAGSVSAAMQGDKMYGDCGGSATQSISANPNGTFSGSMKYETYCSAGVTINGGVTFSGYYNEQTDTLNFKMNFSSLTSSMGGESFTSSGSISMDLNLGDPYSSQIIEMTMNVTDPATGEVCRLEGYKMTVTPGSAYDLVAIAGRYYHDVIGYVDISTNQVIEVSVDGIPHGGMMLFEGADNTWATLEFTGDGGYTIIASDTTTVVGTLVEGAL